MATMTLAQERRLEAMRPDDAEPLRYAKCTDCGGARKMDAPCSRHGGDCACATGTVDCERCDGSGSEPCSFCSGTNPALADAFGTICAECLRESEADQELELAFCNAQEEDAARDVAILVARAKGSIRQVVCSRPEDEKTAAIAVLEWALKEALVEVRRARAELRRGEVRIADRHLSNAEGFTRGR